MINQEIYKFLTDLSLNNNRDWFQENRKRYDSSRQSFIYALEIIIHEIAQFDKSISSVTPKDSIFRINRDVRFSANKSPYKTNIGAFICPGGRNSGKAGYYLHIEPGSSMLAGGIYMPPAPALKAIRQEIFENYSEFKSIVDHPDFKLNFKDFFGERLKTKPRGFSEDFEGIEYLRLKHFSVFKTKTDNEMIQGEVLEEILTVFEAIYPLNRFLNTIVSEL